LIGRRQKRREHFDVVMRVLVCDPALRHRPIMKRKPRAGRDRRRRGSNGSQPVDPAFGRAARPICDHAAA